MKASWIRLAALLSASYACGGPSAPEVSPGRPAASTTSAVVSDARPATPRPAASSGPDAGAPARAPSMFDLQMRSLRSYVHAFNRHDAKAIAALYAEDAVFVERGEFVSAGGGSIDANYREHFEAFPDATTSITRSWHRGDAVVFEYVEGGTHTGRHRAHQPTGKKVGYVGASVLRFNPEGLVKSDTTYSDELTKEVQAGWAPGPLAKMKVRPVMPVPTAADAWEVHEVSERDAPPKESAAQKSLYATFSSKSDRDFLAALADDVVLIPYDDPADARGKEQAGALFRDWTKAFADGSVEATEGWAADGYFVVLGTYTGRHAGVWGPVKPTNKTFASHFLDIAKVGRDGKIERLWSYANNYELLKHLGYRKTEVVAGAGK